MGEQCNAVATIDLVRLSAYLADKAGHYESLGLDQIARGFREAADRAEELEAEVTIRTAATVKAAAMLNKLAPRTEFLWSANEFWHAAFNEHHGQ